MSKNWTLEQLPVGARDPGQARDVDPVFGEGFGLGGRGFAIDAAGIGFAVVDPARLFGEIAADVVAILLHLGTHALQQSDKLRGHRA